MKKENEKIENEVIEEMQQKPKKELGEIPTDDKKILEKLQEIQDKIESFEILEDDIKDDKDDKKKNIGLVLAFVALAVVAVGLFSFKKGLKDENK